MIGKATPMKHLLSFALIASLVACGGGGKKQIPRGPDGPTGPTEPGPGTTKAEPPIPEPPPATGNPKADLIPRSVLFGNPERARRADQPRRQAACRGSRRRTACSTCGSRRSASSIRPRPSPNDTTRPIRIYFWAYTNKHILYMQDAGGDENFHVFRVDLADGKITTSRRSRARARPSRR